ncbi:hypothetical protein K491DRAFT_719359 [Lophiostoma macrostomum CBS 122681]|uniref:Uncharacterized protein n=1 Tax=Lophiostoma macrostomum CBS 122681 TaxID=1314788 RepID=A0A6A6SW54_9PLEO|nr:hypothetical protein K491DRAFT_719359 [Lophiostoma macrostomum CBS 122681]
MYTFYFCKTPLIPPPEYSVPDPESDPEWYGEVYLHYPQSTVRTPLLFGSLFRETVRLRLIQADIAIVAYAPSKKEQGLSLEQSLTFKGKLDDWLQALPAPFSASELVFPSHISLHLEYHGVILSLLRPHESTGASPLLVEDITRAKMSLETLARLYYLRHSYDSCDVFICNFLIYVGNIAIESLGRHSAVTAPDVLRSTLILCARGLKSQSTHYYLGSLVYRALRACMSVDDVGRLGSWISSQDDNVDELMAAEHIQAQWPIPHAMQPNEDPKKGELKRLVGYPESDMNGTNEHPEDWNELRTNSPAEAGW